MNRRTFNNLLALLGVFFAMALIGLAAFYGEMLR